MNITNLPYNILLKISSSLIDRDVKALGTTSKKMQELAIKELEARDKKLEELLSPYTASRYFNISSLKEADLFLLGENHTNSQSNKVAFFRFLLSRGPLILLLESYASMQVIHDKPNLLSLGWDDVSSQEEGNSIWEKYEQKKEDLRGPKAQTFDLELQKQKEKLIQEKEKLIQRKTAIKLMSSVLESSKKEVLEILNSEEGLIEEQVKDLDMKIKYPKLLDPNIEQEYKILLIEEKIEWSNLLAKTFPGRVVAMVNSLQKIGDFIAQKRKNWVRPKIVLEAGWSHLEGDKEALLYDGHYLKPLYEQLQYHRAVVLLPTSHLSDDLIEGIKKIKDPVNDLPYKITRIVAKCNVGSGNTLFIRGNIDNVLDWGKGVKMVNRDNDTWIFATSEDVPDSFPYKFLINDVQWENGEDHMATGGQKNMMVPRF